MKYIKQNMKHKTINQILGEMLNLLVSMVRGFYFEEYNLVNECMVQHAVSPLCQKYIQLIFS